MSNRSKRKLIAKETMAIVERGNYNAPAGGTLDIASDIERAIDGTRTYSPNDFEKLEEDVASKLGSLSFQTKISASNATTFAATKEILRREPGARIFALNFASAKNAGGGFLSGSQAQEEALCRASALYACIHSHRDYYEFNQQSGTSLYTDYMIYSPAVPVFRGDADELIEDPYNVSILTAPAPNKGAVEKNEPEKISRVGETMFARIEKVLAVAVSYEYRHVVLGAWGCGVFRNDPVEVAGQFHALLTGTGRFAKAFETVSFGVLDFAKGTPTFKAFANRFNQVEV